MELHIRLTRTGDLSVQIYRQIREAVLDGRLGPGDRLPPTRELARRLEVSRNTVAVGYELLSADGIVEGRVGDGSFVSDFASRRAEMRAAPKGAICPRAVWDTLPKGGWEKPSQAYDFDFSVGIPDAAFFPFTEWRRLTARETRGGARHGRYQHPAGHLELRAAIAKHIGVSRAIRAAAEDILVTQGAQQGFDLIGRVLIAPGTCVAVEEPGYPFARMLFQTLGARVVGVPVDEEGMRVDAIPRQTQLVYVTPSHQFPLGHVMSFQRRTQLLDWAERSKALLIEDDYDSEFRFGGGPLDPIQRLDRTGCVVYAGSFSKVLLPTLRMGFIVTPASLRESLLAAKQLTDWHSDWVKQAAMARFIGQGMLARHIRKLNREYGDRYATLTAGIERHLGRWLRPIPARAGLHVAAETTAEAAGVDLERIVKDAAERGVRVEGLGKYCAESHKRRGLVFGFGAIVPARIEVGLLRLAESFRKTA